MAGIPQHWEHFPHGADVGIRGIGPTPAAAFTQAALAMTALMARLDRVMPARMVPIELQAATLEDLFFDWLDALVFETSSDGMLFSRFDVVIEGSRLRARVWGEAIDRTKHELGVEVKGPTYTELQVSQDASTGAWMAQCVVDV